MRGLILLVVLATAFGAAALWQQRHVAELRAAQRAAQIESEAAPGVTRERLEPGEALLIVGRPSGAAPRPRPDTGRAAAQPSPQREPAPPPDETSLGDYTHEVQQGQTLSGIAYVHYGREGPKLVQELAEYNGLASPDRVKAGQVLRLPPVQVLEQAAAKR